MTAGGAVNRIQLVISLVAHCSEEETHGAENGVGVYPLRIAVLDLLIGGLQHEVRRRKHGDAGRVELQLTGAGRRVLVGPGKSARLQVLVGVAVERDRLPRAVENRAEREV